MKKKIIKFTTVFAVMAALSGCANEVSITPLSFRYTPSEDHVETQYTYRYVMFKGLKYVPVVETVRHPEQYEIYYLVKYDDGSSVTQWRQVSKEEYEKFAGKDENQNG